MRQMFAFHTPSTFSLRINARIATSDRSIIAGLKTRFRLGKSDVEFSQYSQFNAQLPHHANVA